MPAPLRLVSLLPAPPMPVPLRLASVPPAPPMPVPLRLASVAACSADACSASARILCRLLRRCLFRFGSHACRLLRRCLLRFRPYLCRQLRRRLFGFGSSARRRFSRRTFDLRTRARRRFDRRLLRRGFQADDFGRESQVCLGSGRGELRLQSRRPLGFHRIELGGPAHVGVRLGASPGGVDRPLVLLGQRAELHIELLLQASAQRFDRITKLFVRHNRIIRAGSPPVKSGQAAQVQWLQQVDDRPWFPYNGALGGDLDSTEIRFRRMRAEDHHPR